MTSCDNKNYCATVVQLNRFEDIPNCDNLKYAIIAGNKVIVSKWEESGQVGLFFPLETKLSEQFLSANNLFSSASKNRDTTKKGYFHDHGRIKAVKFRGNRSDGFFIPISSLYALLSDDVNEDAGYLPVGDEFDTIGGIRICEKYVPKSNKVQGERKQKQGRIDRVEDRIVGKQFRFHADTENLRKNIHRVDPFNTISITEKFHGTSVVIGKLLTNRKLKWYEKLLKKVGVRVSDAVYDLVWSSRRVIKGVGEPKETAVHYYDSDVWGDVAREYGPKIPNGYTVYGEIVGYTKGGSFIQKGYHYGCEKGTNQLYVYRVTVTNDSGLVIELTNNQIDEFCAEYGFRQVPVHYYGKATRYFGLEEAYTDRWCDGFLAQLEKDFIHEDVCPWNSNEVPAEGIVVRVEKAFGFEAYKLKNYRFLEYESKQLDTGEVDMETANEEV